MYELLLTKDANAFYQQADSSLVGRLNRCFDQLEQEPHQHPNIKRLTGSLSGHWRYRVGDWRVIYAIDEATHTVTVLTIAHRSRAYN